MQEVKLKPLPYLATDTETEVRIRMMLSFIRLIPNRPTATQYSVTVLFKFI